MVQEGKNGLTTSSKRWWFAGFCAIAVVVGTYVLARAPQDREDLAFVGSVSEKVRARMLSLLPDPNETASCTDEVVRGHRIKCSRTPRGTCTLLVPPGTEILFELNRAIPPYDAFLVEVSSELERQASELRWVPPPPQPVVVGSSGQWGGDGLVWATDKYILYVASDHPGNHDTLSLWEPAGIRGTHGFSLTIVSSGKGVPGTRLTDVPKDSWWGLGSGLRLRVVRTRSAEELGENRLLPPGAFEMQGHNLSDGGSYPLYRLPGRPLSKRPDLAQMTEHQRQVWQAEAQEMVRQYLRDANVGK